MNMLAMHAEFRGMRKRAQRAMALSVALHALLLFALVRLQGAKAEEPRIVEVSWLEPAAVVEPVVAPPVVVAPPAPQEKPAPPKVTEPAPRTAPTKRPQPAGPTPAERHAAAEAADRQAKLDRLAATRATVSRELDVAPASSATRQLLAGAPTGGSDLTRLAAATMAPVAQKGRPVALARGPEVKAAALALNRGPAVVGGGLPAAAEGPGAGRGAGSATEAAAEPATMTVTPGDVVLDGPAAARAVVSQVLPTYPDWARRQAVEAVVKLQFTVLPDGRVREDLQVTRTGGFREFDDRAASALRRWRFAPLAGGDAAGQMGTITFRFRLHG